MAFVSRAEVTGLYPSVFLAGPYAALSFNLKVMTSASNPKPPPFTKLSLIFEFLGFIVYHLFIQTSTPNPLLKGRRPRCFGNG